MEAPEIQQHEIAEIEEFAAKRDTMLGEIRKVIVGQDRVIEEVLIALFARGHCLLVGVPGLAKTLLISTLSEILDLDFNRIQFTPDLMPSDITGTDILQEDAATGRRKFQFLKGPIFTNILLADEINRTPPKTQGRALAIDAGIQSHRRRQHLSPRPAVFRSGNAKPHRTGRDLPAAGSAARPFHVEYRDPLPGLRRRSANRHADHVE
jgi:MoxR-like ATPase